MAITISHRNQNITGPHAFGGHSPVVGGMVRIDGQRWLVKHQEGLFILCKKLFGFIAEVRQPSYKSIAKTTSRSRSACIPAEAAIQVPTRSLLALTLDPATRLAPSPSRSPRLRHTRGRAKLCPAKTTEVTSCMKD